jgi:DNA-binding FadR family transcriptional regulator
VLQPYRNFRLDQSSRRKESLAQHRTIFEAIRSSDGDLAARQMASHVKIGAIIADFVFNLPSQSIIGGENGN